MVTGRAVALWRVAQQYRESLPAEHSGRPRFCFDLALDRLHLGGHVDVDLIELARLVERGEVRIVLRARARPRERVVGFGEPGKHPLQLGFEGAELFAEVAIRMDRR